MRQSSQSPCFHDIVMIYLIHVLDILDIRDIQYTELDILDIHLFDIQQVRKIRCTAGSTNLVKHQKKFKLQRVLLTVSTGQCHRVSKTCCR